MLVLLHHLPADSPLALAVGPEWWWGRSGVSQHLQAETLDALNRVLTACSAMVVAHGVKAKDVTKAVAGTPRWERPWTPPAPPAPKRTLADKARALLASLGR